MEFTVNLRIINAFAKHVAPKKDIRDYLCAVCVEAAPDAIYYVATNGHMLAVAREAYQECDKAPEKAVQYIIPKAIALKVKPGKSLDHGFMTVRAVKTIGGSDCGQEFTLRNGETIGGNLIDSHYPDWRRVIPRELSGEAAQYNPEYLAALQSAFQDAFNAVAKLELKTNGSSVAAVANAAYEFYGAIMPFRSGAVFAVPAWVTENPAQARQAA